MFWAPPWEKFSQRCACVAVGPSQSRLRDCSKTTQDRILSSSDTPHPGEEFSQRCACVAVGPSPSRLQHRSKTTQVAIIELRYPHLGEEFSQRNAHAVLASRWLAIANAHAVLANFCALKLVILRLDCDGCFNVCVCWVLCAPPLA